MFSHFGDIILKKPDKNEAKLSPRKGEKSGQQQKEKIIEGDAKLAVGSACFVIAKENMLAATCSKSLGISNQPISMLPKIRSEITTIHETVTTVQSLIPVIKDGRDGQSLIKKLYDVNVRMQSLLPMMNVFMSELPPEDKDEMEIWKLERENLNREFETVLKNFQNVQEGVMSAVKSLTPRNSMSN